MQPNQGLDEWQRIKRLTTCSTTGTWQQGHLPDQDLRGASHYMQPPSVNGPGRKTLHSCKGHNSSNDLPAHAEASSLAMTEPVLRLVLETVRRQQLHAGTNAAIAFENSRGRLVLGEDDAGVAGRAVEAQAHGHDAPGLQVHRGH